MKKARKTKEAARSSKKSNANEKNVPVHPPASVRKRKAASSNESEVVDDSVEDKPSVDGVVDDIQVTDNTNVGAIVLVTDNTNAGVNVSATDDIDVGVDAEATEPFPGGPTDTSLLKSFKSHVAAAVWNNEERGPLRCMSKWNTLKEWKWQDKQNNNTFRKYITESCLLPLLECTYRIVDKIVVSAFVERWQPETNTFHLPFGEMTITLDDVSNLIGVPITGKAISLQADDVMSNHELLVELLGVNDEEATEALSEFNEEYVTLSWLRKHFEGVSDTDSTEANKCAARAYLLYLLGCTLFVDKSGTRVHVTYLRLLRDLDAVRGYAWGASALAWLYRQLGQSTRSKVKQMSGYMTLLEAWVYEHMHLICSPNYDQNYSDIDPRACRWKPRTSSGTTTDDLQKMRKKLDSLTANQVTWEPYTSRKQAQPFHEITYFTGMLKCFDVVEPYCPERVLRQFGRVQTIPKAPCVLPRSTRATHASVNKLLYEYIDGMWDGWQNHVLHQNNRSSPVSIASDVVSGYLDWYHKVSHPYVHNPAHSTSSFDPQYTSHTSYYQDRVQRILNITRRIVDMGKEVALRDFPDDVYNAVESIQNLLEGRSSDG
ncbi:hypothetical protein ACFX13_023777 [Malus domestica]